MRRAVWLAAWPAGVALGAASAVIAHRNPGYALADTNALIAVELVAGYVVIACGLECWRRRSGGLFAVLLAAGGFGWFLLEWNNPGVGSPLVFTIGLLLYAAAPPFVAHALLTYPARPLGRVERVVVAAAYGGSLLLLGLLPALVFDPAAQGCSECPRNLALVPGNASLWEDFNRAGIYLGLAWAAAAVALLGWRLVRSTAALRALIAPVAAAGCLYLGLVAAEFVASLGRGYLSNDPLDRRLWLAAALALILLTLAVAWSWARARRTRIRAGAAGRRAGGNSLARPARTSPGSQPRRPRAAALLSTRGWPLRQCRRAAATAGRNFHGAGARRRRGCSADPQAGPPR